MTGIAIILNPTKVDDEAELIDDVRRRCREAGEPDPLVLRTTTEDPGAGLIARGLEQGVELFVVCGGDGTVASCASGLAGTADPHAVAMAIVPYGTGNLLARNLDLPLDREAALDIAFSGARKLLDVLATPDDRFVVMAGLGFDATMMRETKQTAKERFGWPAYLGGLTRALRRTPRARFTIDVAGSQTVRFTGIGVLVGNVGTVQGGVAVMPDADPSDGRLDVMLLAPRKPSDWGVLVLNLFRGHPASGRQAALLSGTSVRIVVDQAVPYELDGELAGELSELTVEVLPSALSVCVA